MGAAAVAAYSPRSSLASSSFSSSSGLQSGRAAPLTVSVPRPARPPARPRRPSRAAAPPHSGGAGWGSRTAARRREHPGRAGAGCAWAWPAILPGLAREGSRRDEARRPAARRTPVQAAQPSSRLVVWPRLAAGQARPSLSPQLGCALRGQLPSVLCTSSAVVWWRPALTTQPTRLFTQELNPNGVRDNSHSCLLLDDCSFLSTFLVKGMSLLCHASPALGLH